jgi:hypothetical protein
VREKEGRITMDGHYANVFSNQAGITARVCSRGLVSLSVGHTCLTLRREEFLRLAHIVRVAETQLFGRRNAGQAEQQH